MRWDKQTWRIVCTQIGTLQYFNSCLDNLVRIMTTSKRLRYYYYFLLVYLVSQIFFVTIFRRYNQDTHTNAFKVLKIYKELAMKLRQSAEIDNSGLYKILKVKSTKSKSKDDITVISQCSSNHFMSVENLFTAWEGPVSVAIYSETQHIESTLLDLARFLYCFEQKDFQMQLVTPIQDVNVKEYKFAFELLSTSEVSVSCSSSYLSAQNGRRNYNWSSSYPINLLRNVAKKESSTDYILVIDIDMIPSCNLRYDFLNFIKISPTASEKVVYVVPGFETEFDVPTPKDKTKLVKLYLDSKARPFYAVPCSECQRLTGYMDFLASELFSGVEILKRVIWKHPWEPFFIAHREIPNFDERFKQYGMNRVSQICELHVAGFDFLVLDNVFLIHKGFKKLGDFHETKNKEMEANRRIYKRFKTEIKYKYPDSGRSC